MQYILQLSLVVVCFTQVNSQIPSSFEILDHRYNSVSHNIDAMLWNESIIFTSTYEDSIQKSIVSIINTDYTIEDLLVLDSIKSVSKFQVINDSTFYLFIYRLREFHTNKKLPEFFSIKFEGEDYTIKKFSFPQVEILLEKSVYDIMSISENEWMITFSNVNSNQSVAIILDESRIIEEIYFNGGSNIYINSCNNIYFYNNNSIYKYEDSKIVSVLELNDIPILNIKTIDELSLIISNEKIIKYDSEFTNLLATWYLPKKLINTYKLNYDEKNIISFYQDDFLFNYNLIDNIIDSIYIPKFHNREHYRKSYFIDDSLVMMIGTISFSISVIHGFVRVFDIRNTNNYERANVSVNKFYMDYIGQDSTIISTSSGDLPLNNFNVTLELENKSDEIVRFMNIRTGHYSSTFSNYYDNIDFEISESIDINEVVTYEFEAKLINNEELFRLVIPGANFRMNESDQNLASTLILSVPTKLNYKEIDLEVYPNPTTNWLNLSNQSSIESYSIYDNLGNLIIHRNISNLTEQIDVKTLPKGVYFIQFFGDNFKINATRKFLKL